MNEANENHGTPEDQGAKKRKTYFWLANLPLETETCFFILANALDAIMTKLLLNFEQFRESNWLADYILDNYGMRGMVYYKFITVAIVAVIAQIVARKNLRMARWLLIFGCVVVFSVVIYSCYLWVRHSGFFVTEEPVGWLLH